MHWVSFRGREKERERASARASFRIGLCVCRGVIIKRDEGGGKERESGGRVAKVSFANFIKERERERGRVNRQCHGVCVCVCV